MFKKKEKAKPHSPLLLNALPRGQQSEQYLQFTTCKSNSAVLKRFFGNVGLIKFLQEDWKLKWDVLKPFCGSFESQSLLVPGQNKINKFKVVCKESRVTNRIDKTQLSFIASGLVLKKNSTFCRMKNAYTK